MKYICSDCEAEVDLDECEWRDLGSYVDYWGSYVWMPNIIHYSPCCAAEVIVETEE